MSEQVPGGRDADMVVPLFCFSPDLPRFSEPHIPLVAREIMQRMIRQFAAEYTSKTTQDDSPLPNGIMKDQSLPRVASLAPAPCSPPGLPPAPSSPPSSASSSPSPTPGPGHSPTSASAAAASAPACSNGTGASNGGGGGTAAASAQNPVLSKLLMADQDGPLDLSVKKNQEDPETSQQGESNNTHRLVSVTCEDVGLTFINSFKSYSNLKYDHKSNPTFT